MASERRRAISGLIGQLFDETRCFDFFQAVRILERYAQQRDERSGSAPSEAVGQDADPRQEFVRFRAEQSLSFPATSVERLEANDEQTADEAEQTAPEMYVNFMGLTGPSGVLPQHYTSLVLEQIREDSHALPEFLDLFNHRLISLFYRASEKYRALVQLERNRYGQRRDTDLFTFVLFSLVGLGTNGQRGRMSVADDAFVHFGGHFAKSAGNAISLQMMLNEFLQARVRIIQFHGQWLFLSPAIQTRLPLGGERPGINVQLGKGAVTGERVWDAQSKFRIRIGPIGYTQFSRLMPTEDSLLAVCQFTRTYVGPEMDFDVQLVLRGPEAPWCQLGRDGRLGWNTWVRCEEFQRDVDDVVFRWQEI